jgi:hypothetical protein
MNYMTLAFFEPIKNIGTRRTCIFRRQSKGKIYFVMYIRSRDSSFCITTGYGLDDRGSIPGRGKRAVFRLALRLFAR